MRPKVSDRLLAGIGTIRSSRKPARVASVSIAPTSRSPQSGSRWRRPASNAAFPGASVTPDRTNGPYRYSGLPGGSNRPASARSASVAGHELIWIKLVADHAPAELRGSAFGAFNLMTGVAMLFASVIAGLVWDRFGSGLTFLVGAGLAVIALVIVCSDGLVRRKAP